MDNIHWIYPLDIPRRICVLWHASVDYIRKSEGYCSAKSFRAFMDRNFLASCQTHDACYSISNRDKNECDKQFKENLEVLCEKENIAFCDAIIWAAGYATGHKGQFKISLWSI